MCDENEGPKYFSREEALIQARAEATRSLTEGEELIQYVTFLPDMDDHCLCAFRKEEPGWVKSARPLRSDERTPDEGIADKRIIELAREGNMLMAIHLYRTKFNVGLAEAQAGIQKLLG